MNKVVGIAQEQLLGLEENDYESFSSVLGNKSRKNQKFFFIKSDNLR